MANKKETDKILSDLETRVAAMMEEGERQAPKTAPLLDESREAAAEPTVAAVQDELVESPKTETGDIVIKPLDIDTPESDAAIDDIVAQESDQALAAVDAGITAEQTAVEQAASKQKYGHPVLWFGVALLAGIALLAAYLLLSPSA